MSASFSQGLHFSRCQGSSPDVRGLRWPSWRAQRAIFSRILPFFDLKPEKIARFLASVCVHRHRFLTPKRMASCRALGSCETSPPCALTALPHVPTHGASSRRTVGNVAGRIYHIRNVFTPNSESVHTVGTRPPPHSVVCGSHNTLTFTSISMTTEQPQHCPRMWHGV